MCGWCRRDQDIRPRGHRCTCTCTRQPRDGTPSTARLVLAVQDPKEVGQVGEQLACVVRVHLRVQTSAAGRAYIGVTAAVARERCRAFGVARADPAPTTEVMGGAPGHCALYQVIFSWVVGLVVVAVCSHCTMSCRKTRTAVKPRAARIAPTSRTTSARYWL